MSEQREESQNVESESADSSSSGNIAGSAISAFAEFIHIRLSLLGIEVKEAKKGLLAGAILFFAGAFFFLASWAGIWVALAAMISQNFEIAWPKVVPGIALLHAVGGAVLFLVGKKCFSKTNFSDSLNEFKRDREWLARYRRRD